MSTKLEDIIHGDTPKHFMSDSMLAKPEQVKTLMLKLVDDIYSPEFEDDEKATEMWHKISRGIKEL